MAKKATRPPSRRAAPSTLTRKQHSRLERERRLERYLKAGAIIVAVSVVGVLAFGLINEYVIKAASPVATVGDTRIRADEFQARVRFLRANMVLQLQQWEEQRRAIDPADETAEFVLGYIDQNIRQLQTALDEENKSFIGSQAVDQLVRHELVRMEAIRRGITPSPDDVQRKIELDFGYDRTAAALPLTQSDVVSSEVDAQPAPTPVSEQSFGEQYDSFIKNILKPIGVSEKLYRSWAEAELLETQLRERMSAELPTEADQITFRMIVLSDANRASELASRLDAGEAFQALVDEIEADEVTTEYVRDFDWLPIEQVEEQLWPEAAAELWELDVLATTGPMASPDLSSHYLAQVQGHEVRELDQALLDGLLDERFEEWIAAQVVAQVVIGSYADLTPTNP